MQTFLAECLEKLRAYWHLTTGLHLHKQMHNGHETPVSFHMSASTVIDACSSGRWEETHSICYSEEKESFEIKNSWWNYF
jgi:hypothetical protein